MDNGIKNKHVLIVSRVSLPLGPHRRHGICLRKYIWNYSCHKEFHYTKISCAAHTHSFPWIHDPLTTPNFSLSPVCQDRRPSYAWSSAELTSGGLASMTLSTELMFSAIIPLFYFILFMSAFQTLPFTPKARKEH